MPVVRHVVTVIAKGRREEGEQPETVHAEVLEVVETARQPEEITDAVAIPVLESAHVQLIEDGVLVPERVAHRQRSTR